MPAPDPSPSQSGSTARSTSTSASTSPMTSTSTSPMTSTSTSTSTISQRPTPPLNTLALALLPTTFILLCLPPRRLNLTSLSLSSLFLLSANHLVLDRTQRSIPQHVLQRGRAAFGGFGGEGVGLPSERAREVQRGLRRVREKGSFAEMENTRGGKEPGNGKDGEKGVMEKLWMGEETQGWKERRLREEEERLKAGEGYGDLIRDQIWEVWNWGGKNKKEKGGGDGRGGDGEGERNGGGRGGEGERER